MSNVTDTKQSETPDVLFVLPAYNEEEQIGWAMKELASWLDANAHYSWRVMAADNASTDATLAIAEGLAAERPEAFAAYHLDEKGRGRALRRVWLASGSRVVAYMDVDLSTALGAIAPLVDPLLSDDADITFGSRLAPGAHCKRGLKREFVSRCYNWLLRRTFGWKVGYAARDAQCGFKAMRSEVAQQILPLVADNGWFFDTELLVRGYARGLRIVEVPVTWNEDLGTTVNVVRTALDDLRGMWRLVREIRRGEI